MADKIDLDEVERELNEKGKSGFQKFRENKDGFCSMIPYHTISWAKNEESSGIKVRIQLVHPDGVSRGIILEVPDEFLVATYPGEQFIHYRLRREDLYEGERNG